MEDEQRKTEPNTPAFPKTLRGGGSYGGLTKREYFAAMALQGLVTCDAENLKGTNFNLNEVIAGAAVEMADALIEALNN